MQVNQKTEWTMEETYEKIWKKKKITTKELGEIGKRTEKLKVEQSNEIWE